MNLNHIFLFLAIVSSLLVLARVWRPGAVAAATWRIAALIVLAITGVTWIFWRGTAGYAGGCVWFLLLFLPAIGLRKMTELATQGNYESARKLGVALQILHPSPELRDQIRLFRRLEFQAKYRGVVGPAAVDHEVTRSQLRNAPAVLVLILLNAAIFLFEISVGDSNDPEVLQRIGALEPYAVVVRGEYWRHGSILAWRSGSSGFQPLRALRSRPAAGAVHRHDALRRVLLDFRTRLGCRRYRLNLDRPRPPGSTGWCIGLYHGHRRSVGGIFDATSPCGACEATTGKRCDHRRDPNWVRSFDSAGQHVRASVRTCRGLSPWARPHSTAQTSVNINHVTEVHSRLFL